MSANQQIEAAHARNLAVQRSRLAAIPEVGIFWLIDNKLVADSIPWPQAERSSDHATRKFSWLNSQIKGRGI
jgi:hypothetical protein